MSARAKTIQIFLPGGDPRGVRVAEITTRIVQVIEVPRSLLQDFLKMPESGQVGIYFLFGAAEDEGDPRVYIGQTGEVRARLTTHNQKKDFWQRALVLVSRTNSLTQTHALFLEWHCIQQTKLAARYALENGNAGSKPHTPAPLEADCHEIFETGSALLATLGFPIFDPVASITSAASAGSSAGGKEEFTCKSSGIDGRGLYTSEGFVVLKGSIGKRTNAPSLEARSEGRTRKKLVEVGIMKEKGETVVFQRDHLFGSPSTAAMILLGRTANGWTEWKDADGKTLAEVKRGVAVGESA
jgi:predicted GIY-YIG superfamily endonuclease